MHGGLLGPQLTPPTLHSSPGQHIPRPAYRLRPICPAPQIPLIHQQQRLAISLRWQVSHFRQSHPTSSVFGHPSLVLLLSGLTPSPAPCFCRLSPQFFSLPAANPTAQIRFVDAQFQNIRSIPAFAAQNRQSLTFAIPQPAMHELCRKSKKCRALVPLGLTIYWPCGVCGTAKRCIVENCAS